MGTIKKIKLIVTDFIRDISFQNIQKMSLDFSPSGFGGSSSYGAAGGGGGGGEPNKAMVMQQVQQQIAVAQAQELLSKMSDKCFKKCITKPGSSLDNSEQKCLAMCMDRYMEAWNLVSQSFTKRLSQEHASGGGGGKLV